MAKKAAARARWDDTLYVTCYQYAREGLSDVQIALAIGVHEDTVVRWKKSKPALKDALARGREESASSPGQTIEEYVYGRLSPEVKMLWDRIVREEEGGGLSAQMEALLTGQTRLVKQRLILHALLCSNWSLADACRRVNVPRRTVEGWLENDPDFSALAAELQSALKDFYESALIRGVARGEPSLVAFVNRTKNKDRGYGETSKTEHQHAHVHAFAGAPRYTLDDLDLPPQVLREIVAAIERKEALSNDKIVATDNRRSLSNDNKRSPRPVPLLPNPESSAE